MGVRNRPEGDLLKACLAYLHLRGWAAWRMGTGAFALGGAGSRRYFRSGPAGMSDILCLVKGGRGRAAFLELKAPAGRLRESQEAFRDAVRAEGAAYVVVRSLRDLEAAVSRLEVDGDWRGEP